MREATGVQQAAICPVWIGEAGFASGATHQGACGPCDRVGKTNVAPPSAGATVASQSIAARTSGSSHASARSMIRSAISTAAGWLAGVRRSGSSACPNPPSALR